MNAPSERGLELGYLAMQVHTKPIGVITPSTPAAQIILEKTPPNPEHKVGGIVIRSHIWKSRWRFFWVTSLVFLLEVILGAWPVVALSIWNWTALFAIVHFLWWIKALFLLPAVLRNIARPYQLTSDKIQHPGDPDSGGNMWRYFLNSAYTWDLTVWAILNILAHTIISAIVLIFTLATLSVFDTTLEWILMIVFHVVAIIESIVSPMIVMYFAIDRPTQQIQERVIFESIEIPYGGGGSEQETNPIQNITSRVQNTPFRPSLNSNLSLLSSNHIQGKIYVKPPPKTRTRTHRHHQRRMGSVNPEYKREKHKH